MSIHRYARLLMLLSVAIAMTACATVKSALDAVDEHDIGVRIATAEYIGGDSATAGRVASLSAEAQQRLEGDVEIPMDRLAAEADQMIPWHRMSPGRRIVAEELFLAVQRRLESMAVDGELPPDAVLSLRSILQTIEATALREQRIAEIRQAASFLIEQYVPENMWEQVNHLLDQPFIRVRVRVTG